MSTSQTTISPGRTGPPPLCRERIFSAIVMPMNAFLNVASGQSLAIIFLSERIHFIDPEQLDQSAEIVIHRCSFHGASFLKLGQRLSHRPVDGQERSGMNRQLEAVLRKSGHRLQLPVIQERKSSQL